MGQIEQGRTVEDTGIAGPARGLQEAEAKIAHRGDRTHDH